MKNDCLNYQCCFREEDNSCEADIEYCKEYVPPSALKILNTSHIFNYVRKLDENITKLEQLTGFSLDELIEKFAAGWTLEPPKNPYTFRDLLRDFGGNGSEED